MPSPGRGEPDPGTVGVVVSSILPFVVVALILAVVASMALGAAAQPATESGRVPRDPWRERIRPVAQWCSRSARDVRTWLLAGLSAVGRWWHDRRTRRAAVRTERQAQRAAERERRKRETVALGRPEATPNAEGATPPTPIGAEPPEPDGVVATALRVKPDVAITETVGDEVSKNGPGFVVRVRSALGLILLIAMLGLGLAAGLGAAAAAISAALDGFVN